MPQAPSIEPVLIDPDAYAPKSETHPAVLSAMRAANDLVSKGKAVIDKARAENREPTAEELEQSRKMFSDALDMKKTADTMVGGLQLGVQMNTPNAMRPITNGTGQKSETPTAEARAAVLCAYLKHGDREGGHELRRVIAQHCKDGGIRTFFDPEAGYLVPHEVSSEIIQRIRDLVLITAAVRTQMTMSQSLTFPTLDFVGEFEHAEEVVPDPGIAITNFGDMLGKKTFVPEPFTRAVKIPRDWLEDVGMAGESLLMDITQQMLAEDIERRIIGGTPSRKSFVGLYDTPLLPTKDTTNASTVLTPEDIKSLPYALKAQYRGRASWVLSRAVIEQIMLMRSDSGAGPGTGNWLWREGMTAGQPATLVGFPVIESEYVPAFENVAGSPAALFGDLSQYLLVMRRQLGIQRLVEKFALNRQVGFIWDFRADGAPLLREPFVKLVRAA